MLSDNNIKKKTCPLQKKYNFFQEHIQNIKNKKETGIKRLFLKCRHRYYIKNSLNKLKNIGNIKERDCKLKIMVYNM